jgi:DNA polymerase-3 subunit alpha
MSDFINLRVHSDYSIGDSIASVEKLVEKAVSFNMKHLALTDKNLSGLPKFQAACIEKGIHPILGGEFKLLQCPISEVDGMEGVHIPLTLLAETNEGYFNLIKLSTISNLEGRGFIDEDVLSSHNKGLIAIVDCISVPSNDKEINEAVGEWLQDLKNNMGENNIFISLHPVSPEKLSLNEYELTLLSKFDVPIVATSCIRYIEKEDEEAFAVYKAIIGQIELKEVPEDNNDHNFKSAPETERIFENFPEAVSNTILIAERCTGIIPKIDPQIPVIELPSGCGSSRD